MNLRLNISKTIVSFNLKNIYRLNQSQSYICKNIIKNIFEYKFKLYIN